MQISTSFVFIPWVGFYQFWLRVEMKLFYLC